MCKFCFISAALERLLGTCYNETGMFLLGEKDRYACLKALFCKCLFRNYFDRNITIPDGFWRIGRCVLLRRGGRGRI